MKKTKSIILGAAILIIAGSVVSCNKDDDNGNNIIPPTPLGGYISSDSVAPTNLIAYWPFDGDVNDKKGNQTGTAVGVTYNAGIRGQAYQGSLNGYATVPAAPAFASLTSYTLAMWYKLPAQPLDGSPNGAFFLSGTTNQNLLLCEFEHYTPVSGDSVRVKAGFNNLASTGYQGFFMEAFDTMAINKWVQLVSSYDGTTSTYTIYQNGVAIGNSSAFSNGGYITPTHLYNGPIPSPDLGPLGFPGDTPTQVVLGTWPAGLFGVSPTLGSNGCFVGQMDEIRVFNKALTSTEVNGLYLNGKAGR